MSDAPAAPVVATSADVALLLGRHPNIIGHRQRMAARVDADMAAYGRADDPDRAQLAALLANW